MLIFTNLTYPQGYAYPRLRTTDIDSDWKLKSKCLQTSYFPDDHTREIIASGLRDILSSWGLKELRQVGMTTDGDSNRIKALHLNKRGNLGCFGHRCTMLLVSFRTVA